jgi:ubiquitin-protein ligase
MFKNFVLSGSIFYLISKIIKVFNFILLVWNGFLIIKDGIYKNGIFKFRILIPDTYPSLAPHVVFETKVRHPLIEYETGNLDLKVK